jgi:hypothetical protein
MVRRSFSSRSDGHLRRLNHRHNDDTPSVSKYLPYKYRLSIAMYINAFFLFDTIPLNNLACL